MHNYIKIQQCKNAHNSKKIGNNGEINTYEKVNQIKHSASGQCCAAVEKIAAAVFVREEAQHTRAREHEAVTSRVCAHRVSTCLSLESYRNNRSLEENMNSGDLTWQAFATFASFPRRLRGTAAPAVRQLPQTCVAVAVAQGKYGR